MSSLQHQDLPTLPGMKRETQEDLKVNLKPDLVDLTASKLDTFGEKCLTGNLLLNRG